MKNAMIIFRKELKDSLRDRRTLLTMIVLPLILFPLFIGITSRFMQKRTREAREKVLKVSVVSMDTENAFLDMIRERDDIRLMPPVDLDMGQDMVKKDSLDALILFHNSLENPPESGPVSVTHYFKRKDEEGIKKARLSRLLDDLREQLLVNRLRRYGLGASDIEVLDVKEMNLATLKERLAETLGGLLPYFFIIFCYLGSMYPAIDLAAGEKERGTLETLLTAPARRFEILLGKFGVVVLTGLFSASVAILGLYIGIRQTGDIPPEFVDTLLSILEIKSVLLLLSLLLPLSVFFAGLLLSLSIMAKSFKEAQSLISTIMVIIIIPAFMGIMPGTELSASTAFIPVFNVSLTTKAIIAGTITTPLLIEVYLSQVVLAVVGIFICSRMFGRESTLFR
jgi:sodium transport system permease protein